MKTNRLITTVDAHIGGEVSRVITGGVIDLPGKTMSEKLHHINNVDDSLRRFVLHEPRGGVDKTTNLVVPPTRDGADVGFFPMEANGKYAVAQGVVRKMPMTLEQSKRWATYQRDSYQVDIDPDAINEPLTIVRLDGSGAMIRDAK